MSDSFPTYTAFFFSKESSYYDQANYTNYSIAVFSINVITVLHEDNKMAKVPRHWKPSCPAWEALFGCNAQQGRGRVAELKEKL